MDERRRGFKLEVGVTSTEMCKEVKAIFLNLESRFFVHISGEVN